MYVKFFHFFLFFCFLFFVVFFCICFLLCHNMLLSVSLFHLLVGGGGVPVYSFSLSLFFFSLSLSVFLSLSLSVSLPPSPLSLSFSLSVSQSVSLSVNCFVEGSRYGWKKANRQYCKKLVIIKWVHVCSQVCSSLLTSSCCWTSHASAFINSSLMFSCCRMWEVNLSIVKQSVFCLFVCMFVL